MKPIYILAVVTFSGKTALTLGIGLKLQAAGYKVGYIKPVSTQPFMVEGKLADEDADFVRRALSLDTPVWDMSPVIIDDAFFEKLIKGEQDRDFSQDVKTAYDKASQGKDVLLVEGGGSMREGYAIGMSAISLAETLNMPTLGVVRYRNGLMLIDDILALQYRIDQHLKGVVINSVPAEDMDRIKGEVVPYLKRRGIKVYGVLPHDRHLMAMSVGEMTHILNAKVLTTGDHSEALIENLSVGAMSAESALPRFRRSLNKAVITGGDRADIQAAALETSTTALVLTGNLQPSATVITRAEELGVSILLVPTSTMETVEAVEKVFGKTRLSQPEKLDRFKEMLDANLDWDSLFADFDLSK
jgi:BioD-like phosphotransacetylase family protein